MKKEITVLYVDDEEINLFLFDRCFRDFYTIVTAKSGEEGLVKLEAHSEDIIVVISDMRMPGIDGLEFIRRAKVKFENIAYYILTAFVINDDISKAVEEKSIDKFFTKPFDVDIIKTEVDFVAGKMV